MSQDVIDKIINIVGSDKVKINEPMKNHITFRVGGNAQVFVIIDSEEKAVSLIRLLSSLDIPYFIIGNGSNLLVSDEGYNGVIIEIGKELSKISVLDNKITAKAGALLVKLANEAYNNGLSGLEFASGIPGTVGGAVVMNAGAYGGEIKNVITKVKLYDIEKDTIGVYSSEDMHFSYRHSIIKEKPYLVLEVEFLLDKKEKELIKKEMDELKEKRVEKQPLEYPSAGSTFKRPEGYFAGKLIQDSGLKGYSVGGAQVSEKHSGFVINKDNAKAEDIYTLINDVKEKVLKDSGVMLEEEVILLGEF